MPKMVNCSVVKKLMVLGKWPYLMVFGQMTFSLGCLPAASQLASARHLPKPLKITFALSSINCYEVKTPKIVNGKRANVFICLSSINRPNLAAWLVQCKKGCPKQDISGAIFFRIVIVNNLFKRLTNYYIYSTISSCSSVWK